MIEGSGSGTGSGLGSRTNGLGCGSGRPKNIWIRILNTVFLFYFTVVRITISSDTDN